jgi:hypothetical protein
MLDRTSARRPAQVNACFEGGSSRAAEIVAALRGVGLAKDEITVIDRPDPEDVTVETVDRGGGFFDRIKALFGAEDERDEGERAYDLLILAHLGERDDLAGPVREVFERFDAARVNYYPAAEADMRRLGEGDPRRGTTLTPATADDAPAPAVAAAAAGDARLVEPGGIGRETTREVYTSGGAGEKVVGEQDLVYHGDSDVVVEEARPAPPPSAHATSARSTAQAPANYPAGARVEPGDMRHEETTEAYTSGGTGEKIVEEREVVYRGEPGVVVEEQTPPAEAYRGDPPREKDGRR